MATDERDPEEQPHPSEDDLNTVNFGSEALYQAPQEEELPKEIGSYRIVRVLGQGGMGTTYEAVQASPKRRVAVKVIRAGRFTEASKRRFEYETQILARLVHPGIAQIYDAGLWTRDDGSERPFMAMEFVNGTSLIRYADEHDLDMNQRLQLFQKVCAGVQYSHQRGVIHRDLKPDNILVHQNGQPKVIDFGVARLTESDLNFVTQATQVGQLIGTLQYMSPEQVEYDTRDLDIRTDVYALGVILYQLLCGSLPYDLRERAVHEAVRVIQEEPPTNPSTIHRRLRGDLETITLKALEKNRNRRYASADELSNDIRRYIENDPIEARPPSVIYRLGKFSRKHRSLAIASVAVLVAIIAGGIVSTVGWTEAHRQRELVQERNQVLDNTVTELVQGVMGQVRYLGNSAEAQRALLNLAGEHANAMAGDQKTSPRQQAQLAAVWMRIAKSHLNTSGLGYGSLPESQAALNEAGILLDGIDLASVEDERLRNGIQAMQLDHIKILAEAARSEAAASDDEYGRQASLQEAADLYRQRAAAAETGTTDAIKEIDVKYSSHMGLGNVLNQLEDSQGAREAYNTALEHAELLVTRDKDNKDRRLRDKSITLYGLASLDWERDPDTSLEKLDEAIQITQAIIQFDPENARRPRDLALMISLRGKIRLANDLDQSGGIADYRKAADLLTTRAVVSPREVSSQEDFERTLVEMVEVLKQAQHDAVAQDIITGSLTRMQCIAEAEDRAGNAIWIEILARLQDRFPKPVAAGN
ncbi:MAG: serine/threonine-protein kinase [Planctomycetota bacterium]|nr:serine/threonine-protein kinase [Planctomycetota bacterium]